MVAWALSGMELTLVPPRMVPMLSVVRGSSGRRSFGKRGESGGERGDGVGRAGVGKAVAAGSGDGDLIAAAAEGLGDGRSRRLRHRARCARRCGRRAGCAVKMAHAAQVAFALFADVAEEDERNWAARPRRGAAR